MGLGRNPDFTLGMKYLIDREQMKRAAFRGYALVANDQPISPSNRYFFAGLPQRPYDPERARHHLRRAGALGMTLPVVASVAATGSVDMAMLLQQSAQKAGLNLALKRVSADGYWSNHWMKHPVTFGNVNPRPSADQLFTLFFKSDAPWNESGWKNERFDQLVLAARAEPDEAKRKQMYGDMQTIIYEKNSLVIPAFINFIDAQSSTLRGLKGTPSGRVMGYRFAEFAWLDKA